MLMSACGSTVKLKRMVLELTTVNGMVCLDVESVTGPGPTRCVYLRPELGGDLELRHLLGQEILRLTHLDPQPGHTLA